MIDGVVVGPPNRVPDVDSDRIRVEGEADDRTGDCLQGLDRGGCRRLGRGGGCRLGRGGCCWFGGGGGCRLFLVVDPLVVLAEIGGLVGWLDDEGRTVSRVD